MDNIKICAVMGENPDELEFGYDEEYYTCAEMKYRLVKAMENAIAAGYTTFITTLDEGASMWGGEACAAIKQLGGKVMLIAAPTSDTQADRWHPERRDRYFSLLEAADEIKPPSSEVYGEDHIFEAAERVIVLGSREHPRIDRLICRAESLGLETVVV